MTTTDTLKLYAAIHAEVPETRPTHRERGQLLIFDDTSGNWWPCWENEFMDTRNPYHDEAIALCRCSALEWACKARKELDSTLPPYTVSRESLELMTWLTAGASSDLRLMDICRAIHAAKGANRD